MMKPYFEILRPIKQSYSTRLLSRQAASLRIKSAYKLLYSIIKNQIIETTSVTTVTQMVDALNPICESKFI